MCILIFSLFQYCLKATIKYKILFLHFFNFIPKYTSTSEEWRKVAWKLNLSKIVKQGKLSVIFELNTLASFPKCYQVNNLSYSSFQWFPISQQIWFTLKHDQLIRYIRAVRKALKSKLCSVSSIIARERSINFHWCFYRSLWINFAQHFYHFYLVIRKLIWYLEKLANFSFP